MISPLSRSKYSYKNLNPSLRTRSSATVGVATTFFEPAPGLTPPHRRPSLARMTTVLHHFALAMTVGALSGFFAWVSPCAAQTITVPGATQNQPPQNPQAGQAQPPQPALGIPGWVITSQTTSGLTSNARIPNPRLSLGSAGRGLPGMPGGPSLSAPTGAQDPSARYMRPPVVGPLFCDPAINITC